MAHPGGLTFDSLGFDIPAYLFYAQMRRRGESFMMTRGTFGRELSAFPRRNAGYNIHGRYSDTYFRIKPTGAVSTGYDTMGKRVCRNHVKMVFDGEVRAIFENLGWTIIEPKGNWTAAHAIKGRNRLHLNPWNFSGTFETTERNRLFEAFKTAKTFSCRVVNVYEGISGYCTTDYPMSELPASFGNLALS